MGDLEAAQATGNVKECDRRWLCQDLSDMLPQSLDTPGKHSSNTQSLTLRPPGALSSLGKLLSSAFSHTWRLLLGGVRWDRTQLSKRALCTENIPQPRFL